MRDLFGIICGVGLAMFLGFVFGVWLMNDYAVLIDVNTKYYQDKDECIHENRRECKKELIYAYK